MNSKQYEKLKVGDFVWVIFNWWDGSETYKAYKLEVKGKHREKVFKHEKPYPLIDTYCERGKDVCQCEGHSLSPEQCFKTEAEAWKSFIKFHKSLIAKKEKELKADKKELIYFEKQLAKARKKI